jgi:hypothetical protein
MFRGEAANLYQYAMADPVNFIDPTGLLSWAEALSHYASGKGGVVEVPFSDYDPGFQPSRFPGFDSAVASAPPGSTPIDRALGFDTNGVPGRAVARLKGVLAKNPDGSWGFSGCVTIDDDPWDFDPQDWGERDPEGFPYENEVKTRFGYDALSGTPFTVRFTGGRAVSGSRR